MRIKKIITSITLLFLVNFSFSQNWKLLKVDNDIKIEYSIQEYQESHKEFYVFKVTNDGLSSKSINYDLNVNYGLGFVKYNIEGSDELIINSGETICGNIQQNNLIIFSRFLDGKSDVKLRDFKFEIQINN